MISINALLSKKLRNAFVIAALGLLAACASLPGTSVDGSSAPPPIASLSLRLIGEATISHRLSFKDSVIGGLSGIDYDRGRDIFYIISDDRSDYGPARFYTAKLRIDREGKSFDGVEVLSVVTMKKPDGSEFGNKTTDPNNIPDPESIRYRAETDTLLWTSEGDKARGIDPFIREMKLDGTYIRDFAMPAMFKMQKGEKGPRDNLTFEGMSISPDGKSVWVAMEAALYEDGAEPTVGKAGGPARFTLYHMNSGNPLRQIAYIPDAIPHQPIPANGWADNGVPEILMMNDTRMLVLERSYVAGVGNSLRVYLIDTRDGSDTLNTPALKEGNYTPVKKLLVLNFDSLDLKRLDNTEGMSFGPRLANGNRTLIFVSDDNFSTKQITQLLAFEVVENTTTAGAPYGYSPWWWGPNFGNFGLWGGWGWSGGHGGHHGRHR